MANPRKFSEKIALLNQKQAEETAAFEAIMREVSDVTSRVAGVASASNSVVASPTGCGAPGEVTPSVKSAGASPPLQSSGKHLRINLGNQFKAGGSLPNVNNNRNNNRSRGVEASNNKNGNGHGNGNNIANNNNDDSDNNKDDDDNDDDNNDRDNVDEDEDHLQPQNPTDSTGKETADIFPAGLYSVDLIKPTLNNAEESQANSTMYQSMDRSMNRSMDRNIDQSMERGRSMVGPMRSRPAEKRHDTSPYSGVPYLLSPPPDTWRRTNSDSALHQSVNDSCQMPSSMPHRRDPHMGGMGSEHRESHRGFMERPRSSCEMPRVPGINIYPSSQPPGQQIPIGNNTGSLPDLSNVHFPPPLQAPLDQEDHSSSTPYSTSPQTSSPTTLSPTSLQQARRLSFSQDHSPAHAQNHLSVPVNSRFLHTCKGVALDNSTSTSQQDLHSYTQPPPPAHSPQHFIYQQPHSPVQPQSPKSSQSHQPVNSLGSYRTPQTVSRPSPQSSPSLTVRSPLSYSNNPSAPPSPTGHLGQPNFPTNSIDQNTYLPDQTQAAALQQHFEHFTMEWAQIAQHLAESGCTWTTQLEMDSPVATTTLATYISSPNHTTNYTQSDMINVSGELGSGDAGYFSTSPQLVYQPRTPTSTQQLTPQTPNTPRIILTDFSANHGLSTPDFPRDDFDPNLFSEDDVLKHGLEPLDFGDLQMLTDSSTVLSDPAAEHHFRLD
ncbi:CREB-regulated transcription coactivator 1 isoform X2 [Neodiprion pinetum]|uniref:CREB-regulated transcription coactivator 1 isoform X2 n=1 Tax=Neodiprion pinetum TaxID=441929 RepID=UPI0037241443